MEYPNTYTVHLGPDCDATLDMLDIGDGFCIYSFDMTGETKWNSVSAKELKKKLEGYEFDGFLTVQTKSCGLTQAISAEFGFERYLELRKSRKGFMVDPKHITVQSITTQGKQELWIGREKYGEFVGKKLCFIDDVVSTGGTVDAVLAMAKEIGVEISVIACVLTENGMRSECRGIPLVALDNIPLPGKIK